VARAPCVSTIVLLLVGLAAALRVMPVGAAEQHRSAYGGPFTLTATDGTPVTDKDYRGRWLLIYFGYTFCPDICPTTLSAIAGALDELGLLADQVQPVFITIDPRRDTPKILADYVLAIDKRIIALTGTQAQIAAAARAYGVIYERQDTDDGDYLFDHTSYIYVVDRTGRLVETLSGSADPNNIALHLSKLMNSGKEP
jgi:protein SCO1